MESVLRVDTIRGGHEGLRDDLSAKHAARATRNPKVFRAVEVGVQLLDLERIRDARALHLVVEHFVHGDRCE